MSAIQQCKSILIVEDNDDIRETLEQVLKTEGYNVCAVTNGRDALVALKKVPAPALVLLDLMMPVMNGWEFMEAQKEDAVFASLPVVVVSALNAPTALSNNAIPLPAVGYIKKPIALNTLMDIVVQYCGQGQEVSDEVSEELLNDSSESLQVAV